MLTENEKIFEAYKKVILTEKYTDNIKGVPKKALDLFKTLQTSFDVKDLGFKKMNISKVGVTTSALDKKQKATILSRLGVKTNKAELQKMIKMTQQQWGDIQKQAHMKKYGEEPSFGSYKTSGVGDENYDENYKKQLRTLAHMQTHFKSALEAM
jgi:hypothetical protein